MNDLINRDEAMNIFAVDLAEKDRQVSYHGFCIDAAMAIGSLPSAEKTGKWIISEDSIENIVFDECKCSECGCVEYFNKGYKRFNYCPNCGARMLE